jgi:2-polyprenyl-3-methyl-5-hydroxy-6-metoxy-1,4-benzoquinol methylase
MSIAVGRRERVEAVGFDYSSQPKRVVTDCNLCGGHEFVVLTHRDRYGYLAQAHGCVACGLVFLNPVMTADGYRRFYEGTYRPLVSAYHGRLIDARTIQAEQREYAVERGDVLEPWLAGGSFKTLLDVGGSTGIVAHAFATRFKLKPAVLDPSPIEVEQARRLGLETIQGFIEEYDPGGRRFDVVVLCQTVDHLLDVSGTLSRVRDLMPPAGLLFVDIVDFRAAYLRNWSVEEAVKVDHPYYLTESSLAGLLARTGLEILRRDYAADHLHISYVCRPTSPIRAFMPDQTGIAALWREIRTVQNAPRAGSESL